MAKVTLYVEGNTSKSERSPNVCRYGLTRFLASVPELKGNMPRIVACGGRNDAYKKFCKAVVNPQAEGIAILLIDSEQPLSIVSSDTAWQHLTDHDQMPQPNSTTSEQLQLMVQSMETWILADLSALTAFYGGQLDVPQLPHHSDPEQVAPAELNRALRLATKNTKKGTYNKGQHLFAILELASAEMVASKLPWVRRLLDALRKHC